MFFYFLMFPILTITLLMAAYIRRLKKHDSVLFSFCANRRETMLTIAEKNFNLNTEDYTTLRELVDETNHTIHYFNEYKPYHFNLRKNIWYAKELLKSNEQFSKNPQIADLQERHVNTWLNAFFTFTPFIRSEFVIWIFVKLAKFGVKTGLGFIKKRAANMIEVLQWVEREASKRNLLHRSILHLKRT